MEVSETTVNLSNDFTFELDISDAVPSGGTIEVTFEDNSADLVFGLTPDATLGCTADFGFRSNPTCTVDSTGTKVVLTNAQTDDFFLIFTI